MVGAHFQGAGTSPPHAQGGTQSAMIQGVQGDQSISEPAGTNVLTPLGIMRAWIEIGKLTFANSIKKE